jgi:TonB-dependent starch-binding outer membrane protein SusC
MIKFYLFKRFLLMILFLASVQAWAQSRVVTGNVTSGDDGTALPGVSILEKGTNNGSVSDADGNYSISVNETSTLVYSFVGYASQEIPVQGTTSFDIVLQSDITALSEIVVVGYGIVEKKDVTGSISTIGENELNKGPIVNPLQQINGKAAGVNITQVGNEPGVNPSVRIRGITSLIGGNDPLVVVDGIQGGLGLLNQVPPSEIESIDILKDASATAIYGSRGAAGVILVTTKKGKAGQNTIEYNGVYSVETISNKLNMLHAASYRKAATDRGLTNFDQGGNTDWLEEISRPGYTQNHNLAFGGGTEKFNYRASGTAILQEGVIKNSGSQNFIGRVQATQYGFDDKLTLTYNLNLSNLKRRFNGPGAVGGAIATRPTNPVYNETGGYFFDNTLFAYTNPVARVNEIIDGDDENNLFGSLRADYEIIDGLVASAFGSWRKTDRVYGGYQSRIATFDGRSNNGIGERTTSRGNDRLLNLILNYRKTFDKHSLDASVIYEWQKGIYEGDRIRGTNFPNDNLGIGALQNAGSFAQGDVSSYKNDRTLVSFLGRMTYTFDSRYILTASFRRDGSSVFGKNNKWANFPSVSLAWRAIEESFMDNQNIFSDLKLRAGFGITGNQQGLGPLNSVLLAGNTGNTFFGGELIRNFAITQNANPDLRWETKKMYNAGLDFALFEDKIYGTIDYYTGETNDLLFDYTVPVPPFPFNSIKANVGTIRNEGIELTLNYRVIQNSDFSVTLGGNVSSLKTKVVELSGTLPNSETPLTTDYVGWGGADIIGVGGQNNDMSYLIKDQPLGTFYLFKHAGIDEAGNQIIDDVNGNGSIDQGRLSKDRYIAGQALPKVYFGFTPTVTYKNFDVSVLVRGAYGHKIFNVRRAQLSLLNRLGQSNVLSDAVATGMQNVNEASASDFWLENGGFTRLENLTIGYRFKTSNWRVINSMRLGFTSNNLFVITKYKGIDPEIRTDGGNGAGIDTGIYPRTRNFALSLNVTFK